MVPYTNRSPWLPERRIAQAVHEALVAAEAPEAVTRPQMDDEADQARWDALPEALRQALVSALWARLSLAYAYADDSDEIDALWFDLWDQAEAVIDQIGAFLARH